jgi:hypothetical protein
MDASHANSSGHFQRRLHIYLSPTLYTEINLRITQSRIKRITLQFIALSDTAGEVTLNLNQQTGMTSILETNQLSAELFPEGERSQQATTVPVTTIDSWREQNGNQPL